jgi:hypothetical protein
MVGTAVMAQPLEQVKDCPDCPCIFEQAEAMVEAEKFSLAIRLFNAGKVCDPSRGAEVDQRVLDVFELIERQRDRAIAAERRADRKTKEAIAAQQQAVEEKEKAEHRFNAFRLKEVAQDLKEHDPNLAIRLLELAGKYEENELITEAIYEVYREGGFSKIFGERAMLPPSMPSLFTPMGNTSSLVQAIRPLDCGHSTVPK